MTVHRGNHFFHGQAELFRGGLNDADIRLMRDQPVDVCVERLAVPAPPAATSPSTPHRRLEPAEIYLPFAATAARSPCRRSPSPAPTVYLRDCHPRAGASTYSWRIAALKRFHGVGAGVASVTRTQVVRSSQSRMREYTSAPTTRMLRYCPRPHEIVGSGQRHWAPCTRPAHRTPGSFCASGCTVTTRPCKAPCPAWWLRR